MDSSLGLFGLFGTSSGLITIGIAVAMLIIIWDWRVALGGLVLVQVGVAGATVALTAAPSDRAGVMVAVMLLCALILALSAHRIGRTASMYQAGTWQLRALIVGLIFVVWRLADLHVPVPVIDPDLVELFVWLTLCVLIMLGFSVSPLFTMTALLLWLIPAETVAAVLVGAPSVMALIGFLSLLLALGGSYLILVEQAAAEESAPTVTDIAFPPELELGQVPRLERVGGGLEPAGEAQPQREIGRWIEQSSRLLARWRTRVGLRVSRRRP